MRYSKEMQANACADIKSGLSLSECAEKYSVPVSVIMKWNNLSIPEERAKEIALRKYQVEVSECEADLSSKLSAYFRPEMSDDSYIKVCSKISNLLFGLTAKIVKKERDLNPKDDEKTNGEILVEIANKWNNNKFIKKYCL